MPSSGSTVRRFAGVGTALVDELRRQVPDRRIWLVTTNDNLDALRPGAVDEARRTLEPGIGSTGSYGIPIRDEIELELPPDAP